MSSTLGTLFTVTSFGESHGRSVGAVVDGCPSRLELSEPDVQVYLDRRRPGQSALTTARAEADRVRILSGVEGALTLGTPICLVVDNADTQPGDYAELARAPRPSHADFTYREKYGIASASGGGRASARETVGRVAAGAVADLFLRARFDLDIVAWVSSVGPVDGPDLIATALSRQDVDAQPVRCPDAAAAAKMAELIQATAAEGDSIGGVVTCVCRNAPAGWGEPVFDKLSALLGRAMLSIPAARGFDIGSGFGAARLRGSENNDPYVLRSGAEPDRGPRLGTATNRSGGIQGGISDGEPIVFRVAFKPAPTIRRPQATVDYDGNPLTLRISNGRHDPCVLPRAVPVVEAMAALVLADMALIAGAYGQTRHV